MSNMYCKFQKLRYSILLSELLRKLLICKIIWKGQLRKLGKA